MLSRNEVIYLRVIRRAILLRKYNDFDINEV